MRSVTVAALAALCLSSPAAAAFAAPKAGQPEVLKVEPPNWWPGHTINPVRLLVRGANLHGARVSGAPGVTPGLVRVNARGSYAFVDLHVDPQAAPGPRALVLDAAGGRTTLPFEISAPLPRAGRFQGFSPDDAMYLLMPDRFANGDPGNDDPARAKGLLDRAKPRHFHGGDLAGVKAKLPYLKDLGITAIWLNPWYDNTDRLNTKEVYDGQPSTGYHGYHAEDFYAVDERFGDVAALRELVDAAHAHGIKVIQDQVANHTGPYHHWLEDPPTPTWFNGTLQEHPNNVWQTWTFRDPYATAATQAETLRGWFIDVLPDLNQDDEEAAHYIIQNTLWWIGVSGLDGIRQDTLPYVSRAFWRDWMAAIKAEYPELTVVGELLDGDPTLVSYYQGGVSRAGIDTGLDTLFDFPLFYEVRKAFAEGKPLRGVPQMLSRDHLYPRPDLLVTLLGLHDVQRFLNEPGATPEGLRLAFTFLATSRGIPLVYYGDEIAMAGGNDPDNRRDFTGGFPGDPRDAFTAAGRTPEEEKTFRHVQKLLKLRQELAPLRRGRTLHLDTSEWTYVYARREAGHGVLVAFNNDAKQERVVTVDAAAAGLADGQRLVDRLGAGGAAGGTVQGGRLTLTLPPRSGAVLTVAP